MRLSSVNGTAVTSGLTLWNASIYIPKVVVSVFGHFMLSYSFCNWLFPVLEEV